MREWSQGRIRTMLIFHLDDSGEKREPIQTLAGYVSTAQSWLEFEQEARTYFNLHSVPYVTAKEMYHRKKVFEGWSSIETRKFAEGLFAILGKHSPKGFEFSVLRHHFNEKKKSLDLRKEGSPIAFCFSGFASRLLQDENVIDILKLKDVDLSFVIESGHRNQNNIRNNFDRFRARSAAFRSLEFEDKKKLIALQVSDFLAFFCRRIRVARLAGKPFEEDLRYFEEVTAPVGFAPYLATDFFQ